MTKWILQEIKPGASCWTNVMLWQLTCEMDNKKEAITTRDGYLNFVSTFYSGARVRLLEVTETVVKD